MTSPNLPGLQAGTGGRGADASWNGIGTWMNRTIFTQKWVLRNQAFLGKYMITYCCRSRFCLSSYIIKHVFHVRGRRGRKVAMCLWGKLQKHVCFKVSQEVVRPFCVAGDVVYNV